MNVLHFVLGVSDNHYTPIEKAAKDTWFKYDLDNIKTIFMYGGSDTIYWDGEDSFYVDRPENHYYNICLYKTIKAFETFIETDFDYVYRTNNSGYFDLNEVSKFVENKPLEKFYCGWRGELNGVDFASGSGYFLSKDLVIEIIKNKELLYNYGMPGWCDDVMVGKFITQFLKIPIDSSAKRIDINPKDIPEDLDMSCYHYRVINNGNANSLYRIHELKCKNQ
jgi:hypothetical protein